MDDTISRAAAINAVNTWFELYVVNRTTANAVSIQDMLRALPSAQPDIIMCKDCKHWLDIDNGRQKHRMCADIYGDWFCGDAERRQDGDKQKEDANRD